MVDTRLKKYLNSQFVEQDNDTLKQTRLYLDEYLVGNRTKFHIPLLLVGTDFQKSVWNALMDVPYGTTEVGEFLRTAI